MPGTRVTSLKGLHKTLVEMQPDLVQFNRFGEERGAPPPGFSRDPRHAREWVGPAGALAARPSLLAVGMVGGGRHTKSRLSVSSLNPFHKFCLGSMVNFHDI